MKLGVDPAAAVQAERRLKLLDIMTARSSTERHARVLALGVSVKEQPASDGRNGTVKTYSVDGKTWVRTFVRASPAVNTVKDNQTESIGGPSAALEQTGRWKIGGSCYWDPYDSGPDQCSPNSGRWKIGNDGCVFDSNDSGPDQCEPAQSGGGGDVPGFSCSFEGTPGDCPTQQDYDDAAAALAAGLADYATQEAAIEQTDTDIENYCASYPQNCHDPAGPSDSDRSGADTPCWIKRGAANVSAAAYFFKLGRLSYMLTLAAEETTVLAFATGVGEVVLIGAAGYYAVAAYIDCKGGLPRLEPLFRQETVY